MRIALALRIRFQRNEDETLIGGGAGKTEAGHGKGAFRLRQVGQHIGNLLADRLGVFERSSGGRLNHNDEVSLIFVWHEALRHA